MSDEKDTPQLQPNTTPEASDAVKQAQAEAKANAKAEQARSTDRSSSLEDTLDDAQDTARVNHRVDTKGQPERNQEDGFKNDTSKKAKIDTTKAQLDPAGNDPISNAEIERAATDGVNVHGGTSVSNEENAARAQAHNVPGDAPDGTGTDGEGKSTDEVNADDPNVLSEGSKNPEATEAAKHPGGGKADGSANSSADKS